MATFRQFCEDTLWNHVADRINNEGTELGSNPFTDVLHYFLPDKSIYTCAAPFKVIAVKSEDNKKWETAPIDTFDKYKSFIMRKFKIMKKAGMYEDRNHVIGKYDGIDHIRRILEDDKKADFIVLHVDISMSDDHAVKHDAHKNIIIISTLQNKAWYFEPHCGCKDTADQPYESVRNVFIEFIKQFNINTVYAPKNGCPIALQGNDQLCQTWSLFYAVLRLKYSDISDADIYKKMQGKNCMKKRDHTYNVRRFMYLVYRNVPFLTRDSRRGEQRSTLAALPYKKDVEYYNIENVFCLESTDEIEKLVDELLSFSHISPIQFTQSVPRAVPQTVPQSVPRADCRNTTVGKTSTKPCKPQEDKKLCVQDCEKNKEKNYRDFQLDCMRAKAFSKNYMDSKYVPCNKNNVTLRKLVSSMCENDVQCS